MYDAQVGTNENKNHYKKFAVLTISHTTLETAVPSHSVLAPYERYNNGSEMLIFDLA